MKPDCGTRLRNPLWNPNRTSRTTDPGPMSMNRIDDSTLDRLFRTARTANSFLPEPVPLALLHELHDLVKMGPTTQNTQPGRFVFLTTPAAKERLVPALFPGNVDKARSAPVTVIVAYDTKFFDLLPKVWHNPAARDGFANNPPHAELSAVRNSSLQGAYLLLAARALGLDCGPMSGFSLDKVNAEFFPDGNWKTNFLCNLGRADTSKTMVRQPRLSFEEQCVVL